MQSWVQDQSIENVSVKGETIFEISKIYEISEIFGALMEPREGGPSVAIRRGKRRLKAILVYLERSDL
jgi:hypothetical protein